MWTGTTLAHHERAGLVLPGNRTDAEWTVLEFLLPLPSHVGRPRKWPMRRIVEAILYLLREVCHADVATVLSASVNGAALVLPECPLCVIVTGATSILSYES